MMFFLGKLSLTHDKFSHVLQYQISCFQSKKVSRKIHALAMGDEGDFRVYAFRWKQISNFFFTQSFRDILMAILRVVNIFRGSFSASSETLKFTFN